MRCCAKIARRLIRAATAGNHTDRAGSVRVPWAELLVRVFQVDVLKCENCGGRMTILAFLTERAVVKKILEHLVLPATGPPKAPARGPAQLELDERPDPIAGLNALSPRARLHPWSAAPSV